MRSLPVPSRKWQARVAFAVNMPDLSPVVVLGRLAIDRSHQGKAIGRALFRDSGLWVLQAADIISGLLVDAISEEAKAFYLALGMTPSPLDLMTLMVTLPNWRQLLNLNGEHWCLLAQMPAAIWDHRRGAAFVRSNKPWASLLCRAATPLVSQGS